MLPFLEFIKLIEDDEGNLYSIFYDNIRDFLGENPVNVKIKETINKGDFDLFSLLNNGVTIVAADLTPAGNRFTLRDYQVVNGCQTSHVLHNCRNFDGIEKLSIPVKIIVTKKEDVKNEITIATNSQTEVRPEQLESLTEFQKQLESYYGAIKGDGKLYYERRTQQYHGNPSVKKTQIITIPIQIKTFASTFISVPHAVSGYYGTIVKRFKGKIFNANHNYSPYYASSLCYYRLERLFGNGSIDSKYKILRFHIMMLVRMINMGIMLDPLNSHKLEKKCELFIRDLNNQDKCIMLFKNAIEIILKSNLDLTKKQFKAESETLELINLLRNDK